MLLSAPAHAEDYKRKILRWEKETYNGCFAKAFHIKIRLCEKHCTMMIHAYRSTPCEKNNLAE